MTPVDLRRTSPVEIANQPDGAGLRVLWRDGHESLIPLVELRRACPCATCGDAARETGKPSALRMARGPALSELALSRIAGVGRYAVQCFWADGHDTGIYSFELLRSLCPCEECRAK